MFLKLLTSLRSIAQPKLISIVRTIVNVPDGNRCQIVMNEKKSEKLANIFSSFGFSKGQIAHIFKSPQSIVNFDADDITSNIMTWQALQVDSSKLNYTLTKHNELLTLNPEYIDNRLNDLMTMFTKKNINKLLLTCPRVFLDDFDVIKEKVEYIVYFMGVEQQSIVKTGALQFSWKHIKQRHEFMKRAGLYRMQKQIVEAKTAPLNLIFNRNMTKFLKLSGLTLEEYDVFGIALEFEKIDPEDSDEDA